MTIDHKTRRRIKMLENLQGGSMVSEDDVPVLTPNATVNQSDAGIVGTLAWHKSQISTDTRAIKILPGTYKLLSDLILPKNICLDPDSGALLRPAAGVTLTVYSPEHILASYEQQIIDITNNTTDPIAFTIGGTVGAEWCGAGANDGTTDESTHIDVLTNALNTVKGGVIQFGAKTYTGNFTIKSFVTFKGSAKSIMYQTAAGTNGAIHPAMTRLKAKATGAVVDTPVANQYNIVMQDLHIQGLGAATALIGIHWRDVDRSEIINVSFDNMADQALLVDAGLVDRFERIIAINSLLDTSQAAKIGVIDIGGTDHFINYVESTSSSAALSDANSYLCAFVMRGSTNYVQNLMSEISDVGVHVIGDNNVFSNCRADLNYGNGWEIASTANINRFIGCYALANGQETTNTYDGYDVAGVSNVFVGCVAHSYTGTPPYHKYGFSDSANGAVSLNRNEYTGCRSYNHGTAEFNGVDALGSSYNIGNTNYMTFADDDATPSVAGGTLFTEFSTGYTNPTTITDFSDAVPGQTIKVKSGSSSNITIDDGALIKTNTGADKAFGNNIVYTFTNINGVWYENE